MVNSPYWFLGVDSLIDLVTLVVMFLIAFYSKKIYKLTGKKTYAYFYQAFMLAFLAYIVKALGDIAVYLVLKMNMTILDTILGISYISQWEMLIFSTFIVSAYLSLFIMQHKIEDFCNKAVLYLIVFLTDIIVIMLWQPFVHIVNLALLIFITIHFYHNYNDKKNVSAFAVFLSFIFLTVSELLLIFPFYSSAFYAVGHVIQVVGSSILLFRMISVLKK
jgi:hypothetical protein